MEISILDLQNVGNILEQDFLPDQNSSEFRLIKVFAKGIRKILGGVGFMQLINHDIPEKLISNVFAESQKFFDFNEEIKMKYEKPSILSMETYYGYNTPGRENPNYLKNKVAFEHRETFDWIEGRGVYPDSELPDFKQSIHALNEHCKKLAKKLLRLLAISLDLEDVDYFVKTNQHWVDPNNFTGLTNIRLAYYPEISANNSTELPKGSVRISEHTDINTLTFVFQDDTGGLEVKSVDGKWIPVTPIPGAIVCNTGDLLEYWTMGLYPATFHRILIPTLNNDDWSIKSRYSISYFTGPDTIAAVTPLKISKTSEEEERLSKSSKIYSTKPVNAMESVMGKIKIAYTNNYVNKNVK